MTYSSDVKVLILAGGKGSRLGQITKDCPKPLLTINSRPFITYILDKLQKQDFYDITISIGYLSEKFHEYFQSANNNYSVNFIEEKIPLGTGGAIKKFIENFRDGQKILVLNGDTILLNDELDLQKTFGRDSIFGIYQDDCSRFGRLLFNDARSLLKLEEKVSNESGYVNSGIYYFNDIRRLKKLMQGYPNSFSFEHFLLENLRQLGLHVVQLDGEMIDIGVPEALEHFRSLHAR